MSPPTNGRFVSQQNRMLSFTNFCWIENSATSLHRTVADRYPYRLRPNTSASDSSAQRPDFNSHCSRSSDRTHCRFSLPDCISFSGAVYLFRCLQVNARTTEIQSRNIVTSSAPCRSAKMGVNRNSG